ncbi:thioredoxin [Cryptococcus gattii Ru294]|nr:thioredoxin [Cryptococcus gattii Ru294]
MAGGIQNITSTAGKSARQDSLHASLTNQSINGGSKSLTLSSVHYPPHVCSSRVETDAYSKSQQWCGPCHAIAPVLEQLAGAKIDVDQQRELASRFRITAMPTFKLLKGGNEVDQVSSSKSQAATGEIMESLLKQVISKGLHCLNEAKEHPLSSILGPEKGPRGNSYLESDVDPELLISIPFQDPVKLKAISIFSVISPSQAPKTVKLFINQPNIGFDDAENEAPAQELILTPEQVKGDKIQLRFVRFQNVRSLHILVKDNQENEETTRIDSIDVYGAQGEKLDPSVTSQSSAGGGSMLEKLLASGK